MGDTETNGGGGRWGEQNKGADKLTLAWEVK